MVMVITMSVLMFCPTLMLQGWLVRGIWSVDRHLCCLSLTSPVAPSTAGCSTSQSPAKMYHVSCYNIHLLDRGSREQMWDEPPGVTWGWKSCRNLSSTRRLWSGREAARLAAGSGFPLDPFLREISLWETFLSDFVGRQIFVRFRWEKNFEKNSWDLHVLPVNLQQLGRQPVRGGNLDKTRLGGFILSTGLTTSTTLPNCSKCAWRSSLERASPGGSLPTYTLPWRASAFLQVTWGRKLK